jgi:hypothetical protein
MRHKITLIVVPCILSAAGLPDDMQRQDQLVWDYAEFVQDFAAKNWNLAAQYLRLLPKLDLVERPDQMEWYKSSEVMIFAIVRWSKL